MSSCTGCTRRSLLQGLGLLTLSAAAGGCKVDLDSISPDGAVTPTADAEPPVPCEPGKLCLDITRPSAGTLGTVGGFVRVATANDTLIIVRTGATTFEVTSAICTHRRCTVTYNGSLLRCPCHGSEFTLEGAVVMGPATVPLKTYNATFDAATNIVTVTL